MEQNIPEFDIVDEADFVVVVPPPLDAAVVVSVVSIIVVVLGIAIKSGNGCLQKIIVVHRYIYCNVIPL